LLQFQRLARQIVDARAATEPRAADAVWTVSGDETTIARLSPPAKTLSARRAQEPHFLNGDKSLAGSAVDLVEASFFRGFDPVNGLRPPQAARETRAIDWVKTSEGHASMRSTASGVAARAGAVRVVKVWRRLRIAKFGN